MKIAHIWSILCQEAIIDQETKMLNLFKAFDEIIVESDKPLSDASKINLPNISYEIVSFFEKKEDFLDQEVSFQASIEVVDPSGMSIELLSQKIEMSEVKNRHRHRFRIRGFVVSGFGTYRIKVKIHESKHDKLKTVANLPLVIRSK